MLLKKLFSRCLSWIWSYQHQQVVKNHRARFSGKIPTILSCNCTGGVLYHDLGLQFTSPTINLYMRFPDFLRFLEHLEYYLTLHITPYEGDIKRDYPLGRLGDLVLYLVHYPSVEEADQKWQARKKRMDMKNIFVIATDRDGFSSEYLPRFNALPYRKKIFTHKPVDSPDCVCIPGAPGDTQVRGLMEATSRGHRVIDAFDWVGWFNTGVQS